MADCDLGNIAIFKTLPRPLQKDLSRICSWITYRVGETVLAQHSSIEHVGVLAQGFLRLERDLPDGSRHIVGFLVEGDIFGRSFDGNSSFAIEASSDAVVIAFPRDQFEQLVCKWQELEHLLLLKMLDELDAAREWVLLLSNRTVVARLAGFLLMLCRRWTNVDHVVRVNGDEIRVRLPVSRTDIANSLGSRPESLSRAFTALEEDGIIVRDGPHFLLIRDLPGLVEISGNDDLVGDTALEMLVSRTSRGGMS